MGVICRPPMIKKNPRDPYSPCYRPPVICKPPMVNKNPKDPYSPCIRPPVVCRPPMVKKDPKDPYSPCIRVPIKCKLPYFKKDPKDPYSPCFKPKDCPPGQVREDPTDPNCPCKTPEGPVGPIPRPPENCPKPLVHADPDDPYSECVDKPDPIDGIIPIIMSEECEPPQIKEDPEDPSSACIDPPHPYPVECVPPMVHEDPDDEYSPCVNPPPKPVICIPPMVKEDPDDPFSDCIKPLKPIPVDCVPPMVHEDPKNPSSPCVEKPTPVPPKPIICIPPMVHKDLNNVFSPCVNDEKYKCGDAEIEYRPFLREVNNTIIEIEKRYCAKKELMNDKVEIRGYIRSPQVKLTEDILSSLKINFLNLKTLEIYRPIIVNETYVIQVPEGKYKVMINGPLFAKFNYEMNLEKNSCEVKAENTITLLPPSKSGVEVTLTPVVPVAIGENVKFCNTTEFDSKITSLQKRKIMNLRGEIIRDMNEDESKLKLDTNDMKDDVVIYLSGIKDLLKDGHTKLHILTDDGNHHCIDIPNSKDCKEKLVVGRIDKNTKKFRKEKK